MKIQLCSAKMDVIDQCHWLASKHAKFIKTRSRLSCLHQFFFSVIESASCWRWALYDDSYMDCGNTLKPKTMLTQFGCERPEFFFISSDSCRLLLTVSAEMMTSRRVPSLHNSIAIAIEACKNLTSDWEHVISSGTAGCRWWNCIWVSIY